MVTDETRLRPTEAAHRVGLELVAEAEIAPTGFAVAPGDRDRKYVLDQPGLVHVLRGGEFIDFAERELLPEVERS